jgi:hypothetical protein
VRQGATERHGPQAHSAFDPGVCPGERTRLLAPSSQPWGSPREGARPLHWEGRWRRVEEGAAALRPEQPARVRPVPVPCRQGELKQSGTGPKVVRLKQDGAPRGGIGHAQAEWHEPPRGCVSDAQPGESPRLLETWSSRWPAEVLHALDPHACGLEAAQGRQEEAVPRHCRLRGVAQSLGQRAPAVVATSERDAFAEGGMTFGQQCRTISREGLRAMLAWGQRSCAEGQTCAQGLEALRPAEVSGSNCF